MRAERRSKGRRLGLLTIAATLVFGASVAAATATASSSIEGVWSFNGGRIAVQPSGGGTFSGTVVLETRFAGCAHPVGQQIWAGMRLQGDGSYDGLHRWYYETVPCTLNPALGPTAWRVLEAPGGSRYLRACFSSPGGSQPSIAADGSASAVTYGCVNSALVAGLPSRAGAEGFLKLVSLPGNRKCLSLRSFPIHVRDPTNDPFRALRVSIGKHKLQIARDGKFYVATVNLRGLPKGAFTVKVIGTTTLGHRVAGSRTFHTCVKKRRQRTKRTHH